MVGFKKADESRFKTGLKIATFRNINCSIKGGKYYTLMHKRINGGFGTAYFYKPIEIDLRTINSSLINAAGFNNICDYLNESYNKKNDSYLRKIYFLTDIKLRS